MTRFYHRINNIRLNYLPYRSIFSPAALVTALAFLTISCEEDPTGMGKNFLPGSDFVSIKSTDTISVLSYTMFTDSVRTDNPSMAYLGINHDPYFGNTTAEFVSQLRLGSTWVKGSYTVESVELHLRLLSVEGDTLPRTLVISEISEQLYPDKIYYPNHPVPHAPLSVSCTIPGNLRSDTINNVTIMIPKSFGERIIQDQNYLNYDTATSFDSYFRGVHFQVDTTGNPFFTSLSLSSSSSSSNYFRLVLLKKELNDSIIKVSFNLLLDARSTNAAFNIFKHDFDAGEPGKKIMHINDLSVTDTLSYVQRLNGVFTKIIIPGLADIKNDPLMDNIAVNKARIYFPVLYNGNEYTRKKIPTQVFMRYVTATGERDYIHDIQSTTSSMTSFFDGKIDTTGVKSKDFFRVNIAGFIQRYLDDKENKIKPEIELFISPFSTYNLILKANNSRSPVKLEFTYTKF